MYVNLTRCVSVIQKVSPEGFENCCFSPGNNHVVIASSPSPSSTSSGGNNDNKLIFKYRKRVTYSPYSWVENIKSFDKLIIEHNMYF